MLAPFVGCSVEVHLANGFPGLTIVGMNTPNQFDGLRWLVAFQFFTISGGRLSAGDR